MTKYDFGQAITPAANEQFAASGGVARPTVLQDFGSLALVQTSVNPPPAASCHHVVGNAGTAQCDWEAKGIRLNKVENYVRFDRLEKK